jgi:hypothetical protein
VLLYRSIITRTRADLVHALHLISMHARSISANT